MRYLSVLIMLLSAATAQAHLPNMPSDFTCPVDGTKFSQSMPVSDQTRGMMLDLQPNSIYGTSWPWPVAKCPTDGMLLYKTDFTPEEIAILKDYVASPEYQKMLNEETAYWVIAKLKEKLGEPPGKRWYTLLQATWQARNNQYISYALETIRTIEAFLAEPEGGKDKDMETVQLLLGELHRRIGDFKKARAIFEELRDQPKFNDHELYPHLITYQLILIKANDKSSRKIPDFKQTGTDERALAALARAERAPGCAIPGLDVSQLPEEAQVYVAGAYSGRTLGWPIDRSGHEGHLIKVVVNSSDRPVLLMLGSYEPTVWRIEWTEGTRILGVMLSGYHSQFASGLPPDTPVLTSSYAQKHPCGFFYVKSSSTQDALQYTRQSQALFGRPPAAIVPAVDGLVNIGPRPSAEQTLQSATPWQREDFELTDRLPGAFGLRQAEAEGLIRPALAGDWYQWRLAKAERENAAALAEGLPEHLLSPLPAKPTSSTQPSQHGGYVVLSPDYIIPDGLCGARSVFFLLPPTIPMPEGNPAHCQFLFMKDGRGRGPHPDFQ